MSLDQLKQCYPWPDECPDVPEDPHGWPCAEAEGYFREHLNADTKLIVECGTWLGRSARKFLELAPNATVVCIDHWLGPPREKVSQEIASRLPTLYKTCQRNLWPYRDRIVLVKEDSLVGLAMVYACGLVPDLIYLDSAHVFNRVLAELALCAELYPKTVIVGDDMDWAGVHNAVEAATEVYHPTLLSRRRGYCLLWGANNVG